MEKGVKKINLKKKTKQFIVDKFTKKWIEDNKEFLEDYQELCHKLMMFRAMWGVEIGIIFKNSEEIKGRELGVGLVEELFEAKKFTNQRFLKKSAEEQKTK